MVKEKIVRENTTLEELAKHYVAVYMDNCIIGTDTNNIFAGGKRLIHLGGTSLSLSDRLGAARGFSEVKQSNLNSHAAQISRIKEIAVNYENLIFTPRILREYLKFTEHIACTLDYFKRKSRLKKAGKKETRLREIMETHRIIYTALCQRNRQYRYNGYSEEYSEEYSGEYSKEYPNEHLSNLLHRRMMHLSYDNLFVKRKGNNKKEKNGNKKRGDAEEKVSPGDAELAGCALSHAFEFKGDVAIVSRDLDILNIVRNFAKDYREGRLASELKAELKGGELPGTVTVYFPSSQNWVPELGLRFVCDTKGYFIFFEKEESRIVHYSELSSRRKTSHQKTELKLTF